MTTHRDVFQALSDPTRRAILVLLASQTLTPGAVAENFSLTRQAVSKHLQVLAASELVQAKSQGRETLYTLKPEKMAEVNLWLQQFRHLWEARFKQLDDLLTHFPQNNPS